LTSPWRQRAARFLLGGAAGAAAKYLGVLGGELPALDLLGTTSLAFAVAAVLFGWSGLLGVAAMHAGYAQYAGSSPVYIPVSTVAYGLAGAGLYEAFRRVPGIGRGMPNLASFVVYALAASVGGLLTATVISLGFDGSWESLALWGRSTVVTLLVFGAPLMILGDLVLGRLLVAIPGERAARRRDYFAMARGAGDSEPPEVVRQPEPELGRSVLLGTSMIVVVAFLTLAFDQALTASVFWVGLLFLVPIYWAGRRHRLRGGLIAAGGAGAAFLLVESILASGVGSDSRVHELASYAYLLVFLAVGVIVGAAWERETDLLEHLFESNSRLRKDLQRVVRALSGAVEAKDLYTEGHLQRVSAYAVAVGRRLGLGTRDVELLQIASALHDVGKIGIPEHILNKPGPLDESERVIVERHPEIGARILLSVEELEQAAPLVLHHQERWDGRQSGTFPGYPAGRAGEPIPLGARIIAVVDAFDAMTSDRTYRRGVSPERAAEELRSEAGKQFDPRVVSAFLATLEESPWV
jgi:hypothetical protein